MNYIYVFLPDFRSFVKSQAFNATDNVHPVFYHEDIDGATSFYKPVGSIIYITSVLKGDEMPDDLTIAELKREFNAIESAQRIDRPYLLSGKIE